MPISSRLLRRVLVPSMLTMTSMVAQSLGEEISGAEMAFNKAIKLNDHDAQAWLGHVFEAASVRARARICYRKAWQEIQPSLTSSVLTRAHSLRLKDWGEPLLRQARLHTASGPPCTADRLIEPSSRYNSIQIASDRFDDSDAATNGSIGSPRVNLPLRLRRIIRVKRG